MWCWFWKASSIPIHFFLSISRQSPAPPPSGYHSGEGKTFMIHSPDTGCFSNLFFTVFLIHLQFWEGGYISSSFPPLWILSTLLSSALIKTNLLPTTISTVVPAIIQVCAVVPNQDSWKSTIQGREWNNPKRTICIHTCCVRGNAGRPCTTLKRHWANKALIKKQERLHETQKLRKQKFKHKIFRVKANMWTWKETWSLRALIPVIMKRNCRLQRKTRLSTTCHPPQVSV